MEFIILYLNRLWLTDETKAAPPLPPTEGRFEVVIDNDVISRLDLSPFQAATGMKSPLSGKQVNIKLENCLASRLWHTNLRSLLGCCLVEYLMLQ